MSAEGTGNEFAGNGGGLLGGLATGSPQAKDTTAAFNTVRSDRLEGKVALITGGGNGIGAGVARRLAAGGARIVLADIDDAAGQSLADELGATYVHCDVTRLEENEAAVATAVERYGRLDLAFLNAGIASGCGLREDFDIKRYRLAMGVNLDGVVFGAHAAIPALLAGGGGTIVATASMAGSSASPVIPFTPPTSTPSSGSSARSARISNLSASRCRASVPRSPTRRSWGRARRCWSRSGSRFSTSRPSSTRSSGCSTATARASAGS